MDYYHSYIQGWKRGYTLASRHARHRPGWLLATAFVLGVLFVGTGLGFLWAGTEVYFQNKVGESVRKMVIGKFEAWNRVHKGGR